MKGTASKRYVSEGSLFKGGSPLLKELSSPECLPLRGPPGGITDKVERGEPRKGVLMVNL